MYETDHWRNIDSGCTILTLPFVIKSVDTKLREKSAGRKVREESTGRKCGKIYGIQSSDFTDLLNVKERRIQILWKELCEKGYITDNGLI